MADKYADSLNEDNVFERGSYLVEDDYNIRDASGQILEDKTDRINSFEGLSLQERIKEAKRIAEEQNRNREYQTRTQNCEHEL